MKYHQTIEGESILNRIFPKYSKALEEEKSDARLLMNSLSLPLEYSRDYLRRIRYNNNLYTIDISKQAWVNKAIYEEDQLKQGCVIKGIKNNIEKPLKIVETVEEMFDSIPDEFEKDEDYNVSLNYNLKGIAYSRDYFLSVSDKVYIGYENNVSKESGILVLDTSFNIVEKIPEENPEITLEMLGERIKIEDWFIIANENLQKQADELLKDGKINYPTQYNEYINTKRDIEYSKYPRKIAYIGPREDKKYIIKELDDDKELIYNTIIKEKDIEIIEDSVKLYDILHLDFNGDAQEIKKGWSFDYKNNILKLNDNYNYQIDDYSYTKLIEEKDINDIENQDIINTSVAKKVIVRNWQCEYIVTYKYKNISKISDLGNMDYLHDHLISRPSLISKLNNNKIKMKFEEINT